MPPSVDRRRWFILSTMCVVLFAIPMDMTILYTALPALGLSLGATEPEKIWIVSIYSLVMAGLLPLCGNLADRHGARAMLLAGMVIFGMASLGAALAFTPGTLVAARAAMGVGGAAIMPATVAIIARAFTDDRERTFALSIWNSAAAAGAATGPLIGGLLLEHFWWGAVFLVNVPVFLLLGPAAMMIQETERHKGPIDIVGAALVMVGLSALLWTLENLTAGHASWWLLCAAALLSFVSLVAFTRRQLGSSDPLLDMRSLGDRRRGGGISAALLANVILFGVLLILSQYLQLVQGMSPLEAGIRTMPVFAGGFVIGPLAAKFIPRVGLGNLLGTAFGITGAALVVLAAFLPVSAENSLILVTLLFLVGCGTGTGALGATIAILNTTAPGRTGMTGSLQEVSFELGGALGATLLGGLLASGYVLLLEIPVDLEVPATLRNSLALTLEWMRTQNIPEGAQRATSLQEAFSQACRYVLFFAAGLAVTTGIALRMTFAAMDGRHHGKSIPAV